MARWPEYPITYSWQAEYKLWSDIYVRVFEAAKSGQCHNQAEIVRLAGLKDDKYAGKILSRLREYGLIDKVWVVTEDENV